VLANCARGGHGRADAPQAVNESAFLVYSAKGLDGEEFSNAVKKRADLLRFCDVSPEEDYAAGLHVLDKGARLFVQLRAGQPYVEELSYLLFEGE
jgi:hypothetical protein